MIYTQVPDISLITENVVISCSGLSAHGIYLSHSITVVSMYFQGRIYATYFDS